MAEFLALVIFVTVPLVREQLREDWKKIESTKFQPKWGRKPNDPFTGLGFSETKKAIFDDKLKARIDSFVLGAETRQIATVSDKIYFECIKVS